MEPKWYIAFCNVTFTKYAGMSYAEYYGSPTNMLDAQVKAKEYVEKRFGAGMFITPYVDSSSGLLSSHGAEAKNLTTTEMYQIMGHNFWVQITPKQMKEFTKYQLEEKIKEFANCGAEYVQIYPGRDTPDINMETAITTLKKECKGGPAPAI